MQDRDWRFGRNPVHMPVDKMIEHQVAHAGNKSGVETLDEGN